MRLGIGTVARMIRERSGEHKLIKSRENGPCQALPRTAQESSLGFW
jgi:hypothetical protein